MTCFRYFVADLARATKDIIKLKANLEGYFDAGTDMVHMSYCLSDQLALLLSVLVTIAFDAPDNLSTSLCCNSDLLARSHLIVLAEKISKEQLSLGIVQSCSVLLFLNDEVGVCRKLYEFRPMFKV